MPRISDEQAREFSMTPPVEEPGLKQLITSLSADLLDARAALVEAVKAGIEAAHTLVAIKWQASSAKYHAECNPYHEGATDCASEVLDAIDDIDAAEIARRIGGAK